MSENAPATKRELPSGRPTKLTPETQAKICDALRLLISREGSAASAGVGRETFFSWMDQGRKARKDGRKDRYLNFLNAVELAESQAESIAVAQGETVAKGQQDASWWKWKLERRLSRLYAPRLKIHVENELVAAIGRLKEGFANEPEILERAIAAIAGEFSGLGTVGHESGSDDEEPGEGEAVPAAPAEPPAT